MGAGKSCRLRPAAVADLETIWEFSAARWSPDHADAYINGIIAAFEKIAENPRLYRERLEFAPPVRFYLYKAHLIVFRDADDHLDVIRIRHAREDPSNGRTADQA